MSRTRLLRERLLHPAAEVLGVADRLGRVMLTTNLEGATHERIGIVSRVDRIEARVKLTGADHDALIDPAVLGAVILDRSGRMKDKIMPRLDFHGRAGTLLFSLVGLDGLEPFDAAMEGLMGEPTDPAEFPTPPVRIEVAEDDIGAGPFEAACNAGAEITIELQREGLLQRWSGKVAVVRPAMGFINVMQPDFHLHLRAGSVHGWRAADAADGVELLAHNADGQATGLVVKGPAALLAPLRG